MSEDSLHEISWWKKTDASLQVWGASMCNVSTGGAWLPDEKLMHINVLAALKSFVKTSHKHIKIMSNNTTAIYCINKMGISHSMECRHHLLAAHILGKLNTVAGKESGSNHVHIEWML